MLQIISASYLFSTEKWCPVLWETSTNSQSHINFNSWTEGRGGFAIGGQVIFSKSKCSMQEGKGEDTDEPQEGYSGSEL